MDITSKPFLEIFTKDPILSVVFSSIKNIFHGYHISGSDIVSLPFLAPVAMLVVLLISIALLLYVLRAFLLLKIQLEKTFTFLEVKPPQETLQSSYTTQQLFTLIHGLAKQRSWIHRLIGYQKSYEILRHFSIGLLISVES